MELSNELIIDVALNAIGFLAAGILSVMIYSKMLSRKLRRLSTRTTSEMDKEMSTMPEISKTDRRIEFVGINETGRSSISNEVNSVSQAESVSRFQRNRLEVFNQAKTMLNSGKRSDEIKNTLPISAAELDFIGRDYKSKGKQV